MDNSVITAFDYQSVFFYFSFFFQEEILSLFCYKYVKRSEKAQGAGWCHQQERISRCWRHCRCGGIVRMRRKGEGNSHRRLAAVTEWFVHTTGMRSQKGRFILPKQRNYSLEDSIIVDKKALQFRTADYASLFEQKSNPMFFLSTVANRYHFLSDCGLPLSVCVCSKRWCQIGGDDIVPCKTIDQSYITNGKRSFI